MNLGTIIGRPDVRGNLARNRSEREKIKLQRSLSFHFLLIIVTAVIAVVFVVVAGAVVVVVFLRFLGFPLLLRGEPQRHAEIETPLLGGIWRVVLFQESQRF